MQKVYNYYPSVLVAQCCNLAIGGQGLSGFTWFLSALNLRLSSGLASKLSPRMLIHLNSRDWWTSELPSLVCVLGQTIPTSNDCVVGWVNFWEFEITVCGSWKCQIKSKMPIFFFFYIVLRKSLIIFPPPYIVKKKLN